MGVFARMSGLNRLAERYPATYEPSGVRQTKQTAKIGVVQYRRCVTVTISPEGLYLWVRPPLGRAGKLLIPWDEIREVQEARLYWLQGVRMTVGDPQVGEITIYRKLFERMREYVQHRPGRAGAGH